MSNILYIIAVALVAMWAIGYFGYNAGELIHVLIVIALITVLFRITRGSRSIK